MIEGEAPQAAALPVSAVVVCDRLVTDARSWDDERAMLRALAAQEGAGWAEVLVVDHVRWEGEVPADVRAIIPDARWLFVEAGESAAMKDAGVAAAKSNWVAVFEADSVPRRGWLRAMLDAAAANPGAAVISGRTRYPRGGPLRRVFELFHRGTVDLGRAGRTSQMTNSGALFSREVYLRYPHRSAGSPFIGSRWRLEAMVANGERLYFEPRAVMVHSFGGWPFVFDLHRSQGYADMVTYAGGAASPRAVPRVILRRLIHEAATMRRVGPQFLRPYDWPLAVVVLFAQRFLELPGMWDAIRGREHPGNTTYR